MPIFFVRWYMEKELQSNRNIIGLCCHMLCTSPSPVRVSTRTTILMMTWGLVETLITDHEHRTFAQSSSGTVYFRMLEELHKLMIDCDRIYTYGSDTKLLYLTTCAFYTLSMSHMKTHFHPLLLNFKYRCFSDSKQTAQSRCKVGSLGTMLRPYALW